MNLHYFYNLGILSMIILLNCKIFRHMASPNKYLYNFAKHNYMLLYKTHLNCLIFRNEAKFNTGIPPSGSAH